MFTVEEGLGNIGCCFIIQHFQLHLCIEARY